MYGILILIVLKESIDNQKVACIENKEAKVTRDVNEICKKRLLLITRTNQYPEKSE